jgi:hypothetical protein
MILAATSWPDAIAVSVLFACVTAVVIVMVIFLNK